VGIELAGKMVAVKGELTGKGTIGATQTLGWECGGVAPGCRALSDVSGISKFEFTKTVPSVNDMHVELSGQIFALVGLDAIFLLGLADAQILEARAGPKQSFDLAFEDDQVKNRGTASNYKLDMEGVVEPGAAIKDALKKVINDDNVTLTFKAPFSNKLAESPKGALTLTSNRVRYGAPVGFEVTLDSTTLRYPLLEEDGSAAYNVGGLKLFRKRDSEPDFTEFASFPVHPGDSTFRHEWTPTSADVGHYEFAALVDTLMPVPLLEIAEDSVKTLQVQGPGWAGNVTFTFEGSKTTTTTSSEGPPYGGSTTTKRTFELTGSGNYRLETIAGPGGIPMLSIGDASGTMTRSETTDTASSGRSNGCNFTMVQQTEAIETAALAADDGATAVLVIPGDGTFQLLLSGLKGDSHGTYHLAATETVETAPGCNAAAPRDETSDISGRLSSSVLVVVASAGDDPRSLKGTMTLPVIQGEPDVTYTVSWDLRQL
jgi:hypothetical protein